jgi:hypothetical protein
MFADLDVCHREMLRYFSYRNYLKNNDGSGMIVTVKFHEKDEI